MIMAPAIRSMMDRSSFRIFGAVYRLTTSAQHPTTITTDAPVSPNATKSYGVADGKRARQWVE
jgi:hypothetical protein